MSLLHRHVVTDRSGGRHTASLADCLNVQRTPALRQQILDRTFHQLCVDDVWMRVEKAFVYLDLPRGQAFFVRPPRDRYRYAALSESLDEMLAVLPPSMRSRAHQPRVVFGTEELREKLVAADAGLDDRAVELLKVTLVHEHPVLLTRARLRLSLDSVDARGAHFIAAYDHARKAFRVTHGSADVALADDGGLRAWSRSAGKHDLYARAKRGDHWVSYRRWLPSTDAVADLHRVVAALAAGTPPDTKSAAFRRMLTRLPRGSALSSQGKRDLDNLFRWVKRKGLQKLQDQLFEIRFGVALEDSWYRNDDEDDIDTLWRLLRDLPDSHVEGSTTLSEIDLGSGGGGTYDPSTYEIEIGEGELAHAKSFANVLRHEVGHAVHEGARKLVDDFLWKEWGWAEFQIGTNAGIEEWIALMGPQTGYASLGAGQKQEVRRMIRQAAGDGGVWGPTVTPSPSPGSPWRGGFGPYEAFVRSGSDWYENHTEWYRVGGKAFAFNFWYASLMCVSVSTLDFVNDHMPDEYAAMSPAEFFAELYALFYDTKSPERAEIPSHVRKWMKQHLGAALSPKKPKSASTKTSRKRPAKRSRA